MLKPLQGSGGDGVFLVRSDDVANLNQIIDAVTRDGYVIVQEYLTKAEDGDTRLFLMNGLPLRHRGRYAAFRRIRTGGDMRSNVHAGGKLGKALLDDDALRLAEMVRPKLVQDGMFLVGLDIVGDKLMEINVFSPGGLGSAQKQEGVNFSDSVVDALERKVDYMDVLPTELRQPGDGNTMTGLGWTIVSDPDDPIIATAIHAGHEVRPGLMPSVALDDAVRLREEDPFTDRWLPIAGNQIALRQSRFEVDLNRPRDAAVYLDADAAWSLERVDGTAFGRGRRGVARGVRRLLPRPRRRLRCGRRSAPAVRRHRPPLVQPSSQRARCACG